MMRQVGKDRALGEIQATVDAVPYLLLAATMATTAVVLRRRGVGGDL